MSSGPYVPPVPPAGASQQAVVTTVLSDLLASATKPGKSTTEFWVTVLSPIISGLVGFAVAFLVAHHLVASDQAAATSGAVTSAATAFAAAHAAQAYSAARAVVKAEVIRLHLAAPATTIASVQ